MRITERWHNQVLFRYSYYWLDANQQLIVGWDNAPHHKHIASTGEAVPSPEKTLDDIVALIERVIKSK